jgi:pimeloyl-ACP methyl ester carboxylesterase
MSDLHKKALLGMMPSGMLPPRPPGGGHGGGPHGKADSSKSAAQQRGKRDYTLIPWTTYFDKYEEISTDADSRFRVYVKGTEGPAFFFLHGGGFSGLSWCLLSSSLTSKIKCRCFSLDIRGHGWEGVYIKLNFPIKLSQIDGLLFRLKRFFGD